MPASGRIPPIVVIHQFLISRAELAVGDGGHFLYGLHDVELCQAVAGGLGKPVVTQREIPLKVLAGIVKAFAQVFLGFLFLA